MKKISNLTMGVIVGTVFLIIYNVTGLAYNCQEIRDNIIRLHIVANSDSQTDQEIKLKVRDAILNESSLIFDDSITIENAKELIEPALCDIEAVANSVIESNGHKYKAHAYLTNEFFDTRVYEDFTLPAGKYLALKIVLGEGNGKNWWCIMFPSLCLPAAEQKTDINDVFSAEQIKIISGSDKYKIKFKIIEIIEKIKKVDIFIDGDNE